MRRSKVQSFLLSSRTNCIHLCVSYQFHWWREVDGGNWPSATLGVFALPNLGSTASKQSPSTAGPSSRTVSLSKILRNAHLCSTLIPCFSSQFHPSALHCFRWIWLNADSPTLKDNHTQTIRSGEDSLHHHSPAKASG